MSLKNLIAVVVIATTPILVNAEATGYIHNRYDSENNLIAQDVFVEVAAHPEDSGLAGAFYIGARQGGKDIAVFTPSGWEGWQGGLYIPIAVVHPLDTSTLKFHVLKDRTICSMVTTHGDVELWVGYGALQPQREETIQMMIQRGITTGRKGNDPDHLRALYIQSDMVRQNKYWNVINHPCYARQDNG